MGEGICRTPLAARGGVCNHIIVMARHSRGLDLDLPKSKLTRENLREAATLLAYLRPYRRLLLAACGALMLSSLLSLCFPFLAGSLMDAAMPGSTGHGPSWLPHQHQSGGAAHAGRARGAGGQRLFPFHLHDMDRPKRPGRFAARHLRAPDLPADVLLRPEPRGRTEQPPLRRSDADRGHPDHGGAPIFRQPCCSWAESP